MKITYNMLLYILIIGTVAFASQVLAEPVRPFGVNDKTVENRLNDYWVIYALAEGSQWRNGTVPAISNQTNALEWMAIKAAWTDHPMRNTFINMMKNVHINGLNSQGMQPKGYIWADVDSEAWGKAWGGDFYHYDQMPRFICAANELWAWTRDRQFLDSMLPEAEVVMDYMLKTMRGSQGIVICPGDANGISDKGKPSTYMDCYREGYASSWINEGFYSALIAIANMENAAGRNDKAAYYINLAELCSKRFNQVFWSNSTKRYYGWKDSCGTVHDYGFTYLNLEALSRGLGNADKAYLIFNWLDKGKAQPTVKGARRNAKDIYQLVVAPRTNTIRISDGDWDPWSIAERPILGNFFKYAYGAVTRDGGSMLWYNYYDVMARLHWLDADSAWTHFTALLDRCAGDPDFLTFGTRKYDLYDENFLELGTADNSPQSGIAAVSALHGFMGVRPVDHGLSVHPNFPSSISNMSCSGVAYGKGSYDIKIARTADAKPVDIKTVKKGSAVVEFSNAQPFSKLSVEIDPAKNEDTLLLERRMGKFWQKVMTHKCKAGDRVLQINIADQPAGTYRIATINQKLRFSKLSAFRGVYEVTSPQLGFRELVDAGSSVIMRIED